VSEDRQDTGTGWPEPATGEVGRAAASPADMTEERVTEERVTEERVTEERVAEERVTEPAAGEEPEVAVEEAGVGEPAPQPWRPSVRGLARPRVSVAGAVIGGLLVLLGFALVVQLRSNASDNQLTTARSADLVRILSELDARKDRLSQEITSLEGTKQQLEAGSEGRTAALTEATKRAEELGILAGTLPAQGPGMTVRLVPGSQALKAWLILDTVEELRGAGAEAMQIAGSSGVPVRVIASTYFTDAGTGLLVDGQTLAAPYVITVIGDPQVMQPALNIAGGVTDTVHQANGTVIVDQGTVRVTATHAATTPRYAQPAS
jgi:uncharacterized protein YlxW (UPF0749 family)